MAEVNIKCPWCAVDNPAGAKSCSSCGVILESDKQAAYQLFQQPEPKKAGPLYQPPPYQQERPPAQPAQDSYRPQYQHQYPQQAYPQNQQPPYPGSNQPAPQRYAPSQAYRPPSEELRKKQNNHLAAIFILIILAVIIVPVAMVLNTLGHEQTSPTASPLLGTWSTTSPTAFYARIGGNDAGVEIRTMTFSIVETTDPGTVNVQITFVTVSTSINDTTHFSEASPIYVDGTVSGNTLAIPEGVFTLGGSAITGTWYEYIAVDYVGQETFTVPDGLSLQR